MVFIVEGWLGPVVFQQHVGRPDSLHDVLSGGHQATDTSDDHLWT